MTKTSKQNQTRTQADTFIGYLIDRERKVVIQMGKKKYPLKRFTIRVEMQMKALMDDPNNFVEKLEQLDGETLCKALFVLMEDNEDIKTWDQLADIMPADFMEKTQIFAAIASCILPNMPQLKEQLDEGLKKIKAQLIKR